MKCLDCGSYEIVWQIDNGHVFKSYDEQGNEIDSDVELESLCDPMCDNCGGTNLEE